MNFDSILNQVLNVAKDAMSNNGQNSTSQTIGKLGGGAAAMGLISMLLGRNGGANMAKLGSLAALGSLAYQAYQQYQQNQGSNVQLAETAFTTGSEQQGSVMLSAMISAANADGVIDDQERDAILAEANQGDSELQQWLVQEVNNPKTAQQIAQQVGNNPALATQVYLAARMVCGDLSRKEIAFLDDLAEALGLDDNLVEQLEKQAGF